MTGAHVATHRADARTGDTASTSDRSAWHRRTRLRLSPTVVLAGLALTLLLLPFEGLLLRTVEAAGGRFAITDVEAAAAVTLAMWLVLLAADRRLPRLPRSVTLGVGTLALVTLASAVVAGPNQELGLQVAVRAGLAWGLALVSIDLVRTTAAAAGLLTTLVSTVSIAAAVGWIGAWNGSMDGLFGAGRLFTVGGVPRMAGTWDYPTIAAMAWSATLLAIVPLLALRWRGRRAAVLLGVAAAAALLGASVLLTLTRGAFLGIGAGVLVMLVVGAALRDRRLMLVAIGAAGLVIIGAGAVYLRSPLPLERLVTESDRALYGAHYGVPGRIAVPPGGVAALDVVVTNAGIATWRPDVDTPWQLAAVWISPETRAVASRHVVAGRLPGPVRPGESAAVEVAITVPTDPGSYDLAWDMQQAGVADFSERGVPVAITRVIVDVDAGSRPVPVVVPERLLLYPNVLPVLDRAQLWTAAIRIVERDPLLGVGPGAYRRVYGAELGLTRWDTQIHANNLYLELAATTGLLGLGAFLVAVGALLRPVMGALRRARRRAGTPTPRALMITGTVAATAAALAHGIVDHFLVFAPMAILFWVLLGIGAGLALGWEPRAEPGSGTVT